MTKADAAQLIAHTEIPAVLFMGESIPLVPEAYQDVTVLEDCAWQSLLYYRSEHDGAWPTDRQAYADWLTTYEPPKNFFEAELRRRARHGQQ